MKREFHGISFSLAKVGLALAVVLGLALSAVQVTIDFLREEREFDRIVNRVLDVARPPAARAVHTLDEQLAEEVASGLLSYDFITSAVIRDELGNVLGKDQKAVPATATRWLTQSLTDDARRYHIDLQTPGYEDIPPGSMELVVDLDNGLQPFYDRAQVLILSSFLRYGLLVFLLFLAFNAIITKPLIRLVRQIQSVNPDQPGEYRLTVDPRHEKDELGDLVETTNQLLSAIERSFSKRMAVESALRESERHIREIIDNLPMMICSVDNGGRYVFFNKVFADSVGLPPERIKGHTLYEVAENVTFDIDAIVRTISEVIESGQPVFIPEQKVIDADGRVRYQQVQLNPFDFYGEKIVLAIMGDITETKQKQARIEYIAYHDPVTKLANRTQLLERLDEEIPQAKRQQRFGALMLLDLNHFKTINDTYGHPVGDIVLEQVADRLRNNTEQNDLVARTGGDEFAVMFADLGEDLAEVAMHARRQAETLLTVIDRPYQHSGQVLRLDANIGVVCYPHENISGSELLRFAETALFQAKRAGSNQVELLADFMGEAVNRQLQLERELQAAQARGEFLLHFQPQVTVKENRIIGAETLLRWQHPQQGVIPTEDYLRALESSPLMVSVGNWVIRQAAAQLRQWLEAGIWREGMRLGVNISARQLRDPGFSEQCLAALREATVPGNCLELEVTEASLLNNLEVIDERLQPLVEAGISFALDDFGTGFSSFRYVQSLPLTVLKIDHSFIDQLPADVGTHKLVNAMVHLGQDLDYRVIAENVEREDQRELLASIGCFAYQGHLFSPALPADEFVRLLEDQRTVRAGT